MQKNEERSEKMHRYEKYCKLRDAKGVTDYRVAKETGIGESTLSGWKSGVRNPGVNSLIKLAKYFDTTVDYFLEGDKQ